MYQDRIVIDPEIVAGKPVVKGTRIPVELVLKRLTQDLNLQTLFEAYPRLTGEDVKACLAYAQALVEGEEIHPVPSGFRGTDLPATFIPLRHYPISSQKRSFARQDCPAGTRANPIR